MSGKHRTRLRSPPLLLLILLALWVGARRSRRPEATPPAQPSHPGPVRLLAVLLLMLMGALAVWLWQGADIWVAERVSRLGIQVDDAHAVAGPIVFLLALFAAFALLHWIDNRYGGDGLVDRVRRNTGGVLEQHGYRYDLQVIQGMLAKQAIFTAIAVALLVAVIGALMSTPPMWPGKYAVLWAVLAAMALTMLLGLVSITCYTHALQFQWQDRYGAALLRTGSKFDETAFYLLSAALLLGAALWRPYATYGLGWLYGLMLYRYYFFGVERPKPTRRKASHRSAGAKPDRNSTPPPAPRHR